MDLSEGDFLGKMSFQCRGMCRSLFNPSLPRSHKKFSLLFAIQFSWCFFREFCIGSTYNFPLPVILSLFPSLVSAWCCIDIVKRNSVSVTHGLRHLGKLLMLKDVMWLNSNNMVLPSWQKLWLSTWVCSCKVAGQGISHIY